MGILAILLAVTVPAFRGLNQGGSRRAAVSNLMGVLDRARMMAVSDGKATYVAFYAAHTPPTGALTDASSGPWGRAYAIYEDVDNVNFIPAQKTPWIYLPDGVTFKVDDSQQTTSVTNILGATGGTSTLFPVNSTFARNSQTQLSLPYFKFDPTGALDESLVNKPSNYLRVLMFLGSLKADGTEAGTQPGATGSNPNSLEEIDLNPVTGRAKYVVNPADNLVTPSPTSSPQS